MDSGIHPNVSMRDYLDAPAVSASLVKSIVERCPAAAWFESWLNPAREREQTNGAMDAGTIAHAILLEGGCDRVAVIDPFDHPAKTTGAIPEGWTNQSIRAARERAISDGKIPILKPAFAQVEAMAQAAREFIDGLRDDEPAIFEAFQADGGDSELTLLWDDDGVACRIRPDRMSRDRRLVVDYKTGEGSAEPGLWGRSQMIRMGYYTSAAFYQRGVRALCGTKPDYVFLVQEQAAPFLCSLVGVDPQGFAIGGQKIEYGLSLWRKCARANRWPAYPSRVCYPEIPAWEVARWEEVEAAGIPYDPAVLFGDKAQREAAMERAKP